MSGTIRISFGHGSLVYEVQGPEGAPWVVLCHGLGLDAVDMAGLADALCDDWRVLRWDMPGHGESAAAGPYSLGILADALMAVVAAAGIENPMVVGFSLGGMVAQTAILDGGLCCRGLVAYGCFAPFHQGAPMPADSANAVLTHLANRSWEDIRAGFVEACAVTADGQAAVRRALSHTTKPVFLGMTAALLEGFKPRLGADFACPLFIVRGALDSNALMLDAAAAGLRRAHPHSREAVIPNAGHCVHHDNPTALISTLREFLSDCG